MEDKNTLKSNWETSPRWKGIKRNYTAEDVLRLRGSFSIEHSIAKQGSKRTLESTTGQGVY